jgi:hypothetical protein
MVRITIDVEERGGLAGPPPTAEFAQGASGGVDGGAAPADPSPQAVAAPAAGAEGAMDAGSPPESLVREIQQASGTAEPLTAGSPADALEGGAAPTV